jgi:hypothetical protein
MPQPETPTARATKESLTFDLDQLRIRAEQQARNFDTFAKDIAAGRGPLLGEASRLAFAAAEILVQAAQVDAGRQTVKLHAAVSAPGGEPAAPSCRCGADPVHQMGCDAEETDQ